MEPENVSVNKRKTTEDESSAKFPEPDKRQKNSDDAYEQYWAKWRKQEHEQIESIKNEGKNKDEDKEKIDENSEKKELEEIQKILQNALAIKDQGNEKFKNKDYNEAIKKYNEAIDAAPQGLFKRHLKEEYEKFKLSIINNLTLTFVRAEYWEYAKMQSEEGLKLFPNNPKLKYYLGASLCQLGEYDKAIKVLKQAKNLEPNNKDVTKKLEDAIKAKNDYDAEMRKMFGGKLEVKPEQEIKAPEVKPKQWNWTKVITVVAAAALVGGIAVAAYKKSKG
ncbi:unnamed protein product [Blepharisma stoltei]|uniref:peptidylprolyl isomerase n=1 Tax=Blepharisma stoltei TaxID=1481888 RepID=A0AAU9I833_9CILI|nr:unnamed protein product [Blepharisma stoltei]